MRSILVTADAQALPRLFVTTANFADEISRHGDCRS
jgi:hypothetical protein